MSVRDSLYGEFMESRACKRSGVIHCDPRCQLSSRSISITISFVSISREERFPHMPFDTLLHHAELLRAYPSDELMCLNATYNPVM